MLVLGSAPAPGSPEGRAETFGAAEASSALIVLFLLHLLAPLPFADTMFFGRSFSDKIFSNPGPTSHNPVMAESNHTNMIPVSCSRFNSREPASSCSTMLLAATCQNSGKTDFAAVQRMASASADVAMIVRENDAVLFVLSSNSFFVSRTRSKRSALSRKWATSAISDSSASHLCAPTGQPSPSHSGVLQTMCAISLKERQKYKKWTMPPSTLSLWRKERHWGLADQSGRKSSQSR
mmetsp:Transcript_127862/g.239090  ORF Transcript_127862/g.239090 Transcript_127862/m.239090 type:complete len:236 (+) Transcript_127862:641-1348(+)